jgi:hypothetical protein
VLRCRAQVARRTAEGNVSHRLHAYDAGIHSPTPPLTLPTHAHASQCWHGARNACAVHARAQQHAAPRRGATWSAP